MGMTAERIKTVEEVLKSDEHKHEDKPQKESDSGEDCPLCKKKTEPHTHKLITTDKGTKKCTGKDCNVELGYFDVKKADAECSDCGHPHRLVLRGDDQCISCGSYNIRRR